MDPTDLIGSILATAVACSPLVLLAYRQSDVPSDEGGVLASLTSILVSTAPLVILYLLHITAVVAGVFLARAQWMYIFNHAEQPGWWFELWLGLFLTLSHFAMRNSAIIRTSAPLLPHTVLFLMTVNFAAYLVPYLLRDNRHLLLHDSSIVVLPTLSAFLVASTGIHLRVPGLTFTRPQGALPVASRELQGETDRLNTDLARAREHETELTNSLDQFQLKLAEAEIERNRLNHELQQAVELEQELRKQLEIARMVQVSTAKSNDEERNHMEQELQQARAREKELLITMEKLSLAVTFLRRRSGHAHGEGVTPSKGTNAEAYYAHVLGVQAKVSAGALKERHRELVMQNHPDRVEAMDPAIREFAELRMKEVNEAYQYFKRKLGM
jgi:hypothetical protein